MVPSCGRIGLESKRIARGDAGGAPDADAKLPPRWDGSALADATTRDRNPPPSEAGATDAPADVRGEETRPPDAASDGVGASRDAVPDARDAPAAPDCSCPPDDYYIDVAINDDAKLRLSFAHRIGLYCYETEPQLAHPPCGSILRLSGCAGPENGPPCLYLAVDGQTPITGFFVSSTGQTFELVTGRITEQTTAGRLATGTFSANYASKTSEASLRVDGEFHVCTTLFSPCRK
jgi:hypothetical protein